MSNLYLLWFEEMFSDITFPSWVRMNRLKRLIKHYEFLFKKLDRAAITRDPVMDREPFSY